MAITDAKKKANKKWNDANLKQKYDRIQIVVPSGERELIRARAEAKGMSLNAYVNALIKADTDTDGDG